MNKSAPVATNPDMPHEDHAVVDDLAVQRVLAGEADAYAILVNAHEQSLRLWIATRCPPGVDGDEIAHRAFIKAYDLLANWQPGSSFRAWLTAIAHNLLLAECKRLRSRRDGARRYVDVLVARAREQQLEESTVVDDAQSLALRDCLQRLPEHGRELLRRHYGDGAPLKELAAATGRSLGAIKKHLFLLRRKLHDCVRQRLAAHRGAP